MASHIQKWEAEWKWGDVKPETFFITSASLCGVQMLNHDKLLDAIAADMRVCKQARKALNPNDLLGQNQFILEYTTLARHLQMAYEAGDDQTELERIVQSLENSAVRYRYWRERASL